MLTQQGISFGHDLSKAWTTASMKTDFLEVKLFEAWMEVVRCLSGKFKVEEYHGSTHQVKFEEMTTSKPFRCELCDIMIVTFATEPKFSARLTYLQAKRHKADLSLCCLGPGTENTVDFDGSFPQWYLLAKRPLVCGVSKLFFPPPDLLSGAILPSVGSFGVFHKCDGVNDGFFYSSADQIRCKSPVKTKLTAKTGMNFRSINGYPEMWSACCMSMFGAGLYSGLIGTPLEWSSGISSGDQEYRKSVRGLLRARIEAATLEGGSQQYLLGSDLLEYFGQSPRVNIGSAPQLILIKSDGFGYSL